MTARPRVRTNPERTDKEIIANCLTLAAFMERVEDKTHNQGAWINNENTQEKDEKYLAHPSRHACGTTACTLGWAALSGEIPGLNWCMEEPTADPWRNGTYTPKFVTDYAKAIRWLGTSKGVSRVSPVADGERTDWEEAGAQFFGQAVFSYVFMATDINKAEVIKRLRGLAAAFKKGTIRTDDDLDEDRPVETLLDPNWESEPGCTCSACTGEDDDD